MDNTGAQPKAASHTLRPRCWHKVCWWLDVADQLPAWNLIHDRPETWHVSGIFSLIWYHLDMFGHRFRSVPVGMPGKRKFKFDGMILHSWTVQMRPCIFTLSPWYTLIRGLSQRHLTQCSWPLPVLWNVLRKSWDRPLVGFLACHGGHNLPVDFGL